MQSPGRPPDVPKILISTRAGTRVWDVRLDFLQGNTRYHRQHIAIA